MADTDSNAFAARSARGSVRFILSALVWTGSMVFLDKAILYGWYTSPTISVVGIALHTALGPLMI